MDLQQLMATVPVRLRAYIYEKFLQITFGGSTRHASAEGELTIMVGPSNRTYGPGLERPADYLPHLRAFHVIWGPHPYIHRTFRIHVQTFVTAEYWKLYADAYPVFPPFPSFDTPPYPNYGAPIARLSWVLHVISGFDKSQVSITIAGRSWQWPGDTDMDIYIHRLMGAVTRSNLHFDASELDGEYNRACLH